MVLVAEERGRVRVVEVSGREVEADRFRGRSAPLDHEKPEAERLGLLSFWSPSAFNPEKTTPLRVAPATPAWS